MTTLISGTKTAEGQSNPLRTGMDTNRINDPCSFVLFGASGDLARRMIYPAMYNMRLNDILPSAFSIIGFSRSKYSDDEFRAFVKSSIEEFSRSGPPNEPLWSEFAGRLSYVSGEFDDIEAFRRLSDRLNENDEKLGCNGNRLYYLSTPPHIFTKVVDCLESVKLGPRNNTKGWTRIVVEKPFGLDLSGARALQNEITRVFDEKHIYRIDHYLGKEPVQDIMALRFANMIFEPIWNRRYVDSISITAAETVGVEGRGGYYESAGALRDMIQNHVINLLALVAMEPPISPKADHIRDEKFKVLSALRPIQADLVPKVSARGQYSAGLIEGKPVPGYREEESVSPTSTIDTYAAVKFYIDNWRWSDVPFYLRTGKRLARKVSEIAVRFRQIPHRLFGETGDQIDSNVLVLKIQPDEGISFRFNAKVPGPKTHIRSVSMDFNYGTGFGVVPPPAYERLIGDAMRGDATLFTRWDAVEIAWLAVMPVIERWSESAPNDFPNYIAGSQGPQSADALLFADGREWRRI